MDKFLQDMKMLCSMSSAEKEKMYRKSCEMAKISEWTDQVVENWEMAEILNNNKITTSLVSELSELQDMEDFFQEVVALILELDRGNVNTADVVEMLIMLDRELIKYNNMI